MYLAVSNTFAMISPPLFYLYYNMVVNSPAIKKPLN
nr:MAG TPA: hypothetical protein [Caudoviricetes sp.]